MNGTQNAVLHSGNGIYTGERARSERRSMAAFGPGSLLEVIRNLKQPTRRELIRNTGLARMTVENRIERLADAGWVVESEIETSNGRPPRVITFNDGGGYIACIDIGSLHTRVGLTDLGGRMIASTSLEIEITQGPGRVLGEAATVLQRLITVAEIPPQLVLGVGVGVPSPVQVGGLMARPPEGGISTFTAAWQHVNIAREVLAFLPAIGIGDIPVAVDKDANLMALGEWKTSWPGVQDLIVVKAGMHISCGIIANGRILNGAAGIAGDLEHIPDNDSPIRCRCGQYGCLEATASGEAIRDGLGSAGSEIHQGSDIVERIIADDAHTKELAKAAGQRIGRVISTAMSVLNPDLVVMGGSLIQGNPDLVRDISEAIAPRIHPLTALSARIVPSQIRTEAGLIGAAHLVLRRVLEPSAIDRALDSDLQLRVATAHG